MALVALVAAGRQNARRWCPFLGAHHRSARTPYGGFFLQSRRIDVAGASSIAPAAKQRRRPRSRKPSTLSSLSSSSDSTALTLVEEFEGEWGDDIGLTISIKDRQATFSDGSGSYSFEETSQGLMLRGALLVGTAQQPIWRFPWGIERKWARISIPGVGDAEWSNLFHQYKGDRLILRRELQKAIADYDLEHISSLRSKWQTADKFPPGSNQDQRDRLSVGSMLVPGACIKHRQFSYRGIVIACEPWCSAPATWRAQMGVNGLSKGEAQPFYHCIVDERDRPGVQVTLCAEQNLEPSEVAFPVESKLAEALLTKYNELGGYLPQPKLLEALWKQRDGGRFEL